MRATRLAWLLVLTACGGGGGGGAAGPVFSQIVGGTLRALNVPPDSPVRQLVMTPDVPEEPVGGLQ